MFFSQKRKFPNRIVGKYAQITYINSEGTLVTMSGKINEIVLKGNDYSHFKMNPVICIEEGKYKLMKTSTDYNYLIPPSCLDRITENVSKRKLEKICEEYNEEAETIQNPSEDTNSKNNPTERLVVKGYLKNRP